MLAEFKQALEDFNQQQRLQFLKKETAQLLYERSQFYDEWLVKLWVDCKLPQSNLSLIAVGGYGRQEMFPLSDLDILILSPKAVDLETQAKLNHFTHLLWDSKLQLGIAQRTQQEALEIGKAEISVATNMLEGRFIYGDIKPWQALKQQLQQADFWPIRDFFQAKIAEQTERYKRYHNTSYNLEPDIKHSPGGLRDLHLLMWIALRYYRTDNLASLVEHNVLFKAEYEELEVAQAVLFQMRFALHLQLKRYDNRLRFDRQLKLSQQLGFGDDNQAVESMMKPFFQATQSISTLTQLLLKSLELQIYPLQKEGEKRPLDAYFYLENQCLELADEQVFQKYPEQIIKIFHYLAQNPTIQASPKTLRLLRLSLKNLTTPLCENPQARQAFIQLFAMPNSVKLALQPMHRLGVLNAYLPQWQHISGLMQFDLFHIYTVDEHTLRVMLKLEDFLSTESLNTHPLCHRLFSASKIKPLMFLAALFHDIGKGYAGNHAEVGAELMQDFAQQHGFSKEETEQMVWLVKHHLTMSITAQRRDIHNPYVIEHFAKIVENPTALASLTCLTVADICATNESLWNDWKKTLFTQLYQFTKQQLSKDFSEQKSAESHQQQALHLLAEKYSDAELEKIKAFWQPCPYSYFLRHSPKQLIWHAEGYLQQQGDYLILVSNDNIKGATELFIYGADRSQLFAQITQTLSQKKITIHDAHIITSEENHIYDSFMLSEINGQRLDLLRCEQIAQDLHKMLQKGKVSRLISKPSVQHQQLFKHKTRVQFIEQTADNQTAFELFTLDHTGLLTQISHILSQLKLNLLNAKISTLGERVEDFFVVQNEHHQALSAKEKKMLSEKLIAELEKTKDDE